MRCHDVLGVKVNSTFEEIEFACNMKTESLVVPTDDSLRQHYENKINEFLTAKTECFNFLRAPHTDRIKQRVKDYNESSGSHSRMYAVHFGPCTLCFGDCGSCKDSDQGGCWYWCCCSDCCGWAGPCVQGLSVLIDIAIYIGAAIGLGKLVFMLVEKVRDAAEEKRQQKESAIQREKAKRLAAEQKKREDIASDIARRLSSISIENIIFLEESINRESPEIREYIIKECRKHIHPIEVLNSCFEHSKFDLGYAVTDFLALIDPEKRVEYYNLARRARIIDEFIRLESSLINTSQYGKASDEYNKLISDEYSSSGIDITDIKNAGDLQKALWKLAINVENSRSTYQEFVNMLSKYNINGHLSIDIFATLLFVQKKLNKKAIVEILPAYEHEILNYIETATPEALVNIASIAAWCSITEFELSVLSRLDYKGKLPENLRSRYNTLKTKK